MKYRSEVDGLRAVAVVPVILFHGGIGLFSGGFVGVDVFFVISGYLITTIIIDDMERGRFSLAHFYERRARRILPALLFVAFACVPFAWAWLMPSDLKDFAQSLVAAATFSSNILFWRESGYFAAEAELKPLLHTWSLAVEEQFYILFPLLLMLVWRFGRRLLLAILALGFVVSLAAAHWGSTNMPTATFFLLPTRGWELLIGAFAAFWLQHRPMPFGPGTQNVLSLAGLGMIVYSIFFFDSATPFPSLYALVPTVGAVLIILCAAPHTIAARLLSLRAMVGIGLVSYSAYLWHQPIFVFARHRFYYDTHEIPLLVALVLSAAALPLAYLTWRFIETPCRDRRFGTRSQVFAASVAGMVAVGAVGVAGHVQNGFPDRLAPAAAQFAEGTPRDFGICFENGAEGCLLGAPGGTPTVAIVGDSHSAVLQSAFDAALREAGLTAWAASNPWCAPLLGVGTDHIGKNPDCREITADAFERVLSDPEIGVVVLVAEWAVFTSGIRWGDTTTAFYTDAASDEETLAENARVFARGLDATLAALRGAGKKIVLVHPVPEFEFKIPQTIVMDLHFNDALGTRASLSRAAYEARNDAVFTAFADIETGDDLLVVEVADLFCDTAACTPIDGDRLLYFDDNHVSQAGAGRIVGRVVDILTRYAGTGAFTGATGAQPSN